MNPDEMPPYNAEAERGVIGSALLDNQVIHELADILVPEDFYRDSHQVLFAAIIRMYRAGKPVDAISLIDELTARCLLVKAGGEETIADALEQTPHSAHARYYAQIVKQRAVSRRVIEEAVQMQRDAYSNNFTSDDLIQRFERAAFGLGRGATSIKITSIQDIAAATMKRFDERSITGNDGSIVLTGFPSIDAMTGGLRNRMYILGARPGQGKSSLGLNIASNVAFTQKIPALFVSIEMDNEELGERLLADLASVDSKRIRIPKLALDDDRYRLRRAFDEIGNAPLSFIEDGIMTPGQIASACRRHKAAHGLGFVVIDYIQLVTPDGSARDGRHEEMASVSRSITALAKELDVPILALAQLNRQVEGRSDKELNLSDLRETGQFEQDAHGVWFIQPESNDLVKFKVAKNRGGPVGSSYLKFIPKFTRFTEQYNDRF